MVRRLIELLMCLMIFIATRRRICRILSLVNGLADKLVYSRFVQFMYRRG